MLEAKNLSCIRGDRELFNDLSFQVTTGEVLHVTGPNGAGKTSLLRVLAGIGRAEAGEVHWNGQAIQTDPASWHRALGWIGHQTGLKNDLTPMENLACSQALHGLPTDKQAIDAALQKVGILKMAETRCGQLSAGQLKRVAVARLLLSNSKVWVLDEPWSSLDGHAQGQLNQRIAEHVLGGGMAIVTSHQPVALPNVTTRRLDWVA